ncbi:MAG: hypothetical protein WC810_27290 [Janthinobacterium sp.]|jgi:adenylate kinase family enzyme
MSRFEELQKKLEELSPIPVNMPKLYLLGDTGAGKTTIVRKILGTDDYKFPSVQQKRTTVAVTEYVLSRDLPYQATYIFKTEHQISEFINEILEIAIEKAYVSYKKNELDVNDIVENIEETPDERFRLKYILSSEQLMEVAKAIAQILPQLDTSIDKLKTELQSSEEELSIVVDLALEQQKYELSEIKETILTNIKCKVSELCDGFMLFSDDDYYQHSSSRLEGFIDQAKKLLSSTKNSVSPIVEYARLQGNLLASWLPKDAELVLIDGEGIGHDAREASRLSARHLDYFHFADSIALVEESKKPFTSGGKSAMEGIIRNGYLDKFNLIFSKLDEVEVGDEENAGRDEQIRAVKKGFANVKNALQEDDAELNLGNERLFYLSHMRDKETSGVNIQEIGKLIIGIKKAFDEDKPQFVEPKYDYEMLSSYLTKSSGNFERKWTSLLDSERWQTIKAFNKRMYWGEDEFKNMKPISDFHIEVTKELEFFIAHPYGWSEVTTPPMQKKSIDRVKQEFSKQLLAFARLVILKQQNDNWGEAIGLVNFSGSTKIRKIKIQHIIQGILPDHRKPEAIKMKDAIKNLLNESITVCKT